MFNTDAPRLTARAVDASSVGFLIAGASNVAARWMIDAIRQQPPARGGQDTAGAWVVGVYSRSERRGRIFADTHRIVHAGSEFDSLLQRREVQCVYVGNHPRHHAETVDTALAAHKHVLCEPPLALDPEEAAALRHSAEVRGLVLAINYTWRAHGVIHRMHELLADDEIGELLAGRVQNTTYLRPEQQTWRLQANGGGVLRDRTLHDVDLVQHLLHTGIREAYGFPTRRLLGNSVEEEILAYLNLTGGVIFQLFDSFLLPHAAPTLELFGTTGTLIARNCGVISTEAELILVRGSTTTTLSVPVVNPYHAGLARFLAAVQGSVPALATADDELRNLAVLLALEESIRASRRVQVSQGRQSGSTLFTARED